MIWWNNGLIRLSLSWSTVQPSLLNQREVKWSWFNEKFSKQTQHNKIDSNMFEGFFLIKFSNQSPHVFGLSSHYNFTKTKKAEQFFSKHFSSCLKMLSTAQQSWFLYSPDLQEREFSVTYSLIIWFQFRKKRIIIMIHWTVIISLDDRC